MRLWLMAGLLLPWAGAASSVLGGHLELSASGPWGLSPLSWGLAAWSLAWLGLMAWASQRPAQRMAEALAHSE